MRKPRGAKVKTSEPLDIDWTARLDRTTDKEPFTLVNTCGQPLDTANGRPLDTPAPLSRAGVQCGAFQRRDGLDRPRRG